jgi:hypothetical protein
MKTLFTLALLFITQTIFAQEYNLYLIEKTDTYLGPGYKTKGKLLGYVDPDHKIDRVILPPCSLAKKYEAAPVVAYTELIDPAKGKIDPAGLNNVVLLNLKGKRIGFGMINCDGNFIIPPFYTLRHESVSFKEKENNRYNFFGQKTKNGTWKAVSFDKFEPSDEIRFYNFPENKDYNFLNPSLILFRNPRGKYGIMDFRGNTIVEAKYDTCYLSFGYTTYPLSSKTETVVKFNTGIMPKSLARDFSEISSNYTNKNMGYARNEPSSGHNVFLMENKDSTLLISSEYVTRPIVKAFLSVHEFGNTKFYLLEGAGDDFEIINFNGSSPNPAYKYAYYESIRRDKTKGADRIWAFKVADDYSKPFKAMTVDSVKMMEAEALKLKWALNREATIEQEARLKNDPENYAYRIKGKYEVVEFSEHGMKFIKTGSNDVTDHYMNIGSSRKNSIYVTIKYRGMRSSSDAQYFTYNIDVSFIVSKGTLQSGGEVFILSNETETDNSKMTAEKMKQIKTLSGYYDPSKSEITISLNTVGGERFSIVAKRTADSWMR